MNLKLSLSHVNVILLSLIAEVRQGEMVLNQLKRNYATSLLTLFMNLLTYLLSDF